MHVMIKMSTGAVVRVEKPMTSNETENRGDAGDDEGVEGCDSLLCMRRDLRHRSVNYPSAVNGPSEVPQRTMMARRPPPSPRFLICQG